MIIFKEKSCFRGCAVACVCIFFIHAFAGFGHASAPRTAGGQGRATQEQTAPLLMQPGAVFLPPVLKGMKVNPGMPFQFDFILENGQTALTPEELREESDRLIRYFLASLAVPQDELWVNLSPDEPERIIPEEFSRTRMGTDLLAQDYLLKQLTSSMLYPESAHGRRFWDRVYEKAYHVYGTTDVPLDVFHKVWIVPDQAGVYVQNNTVIITQSRLKVMMADDYFASREHLEMERNGGQRVRDDAGRDQAEGVIESKGLPGPDSALEDGVSQAPDPFGLTQIQIDIMREIILPEIEREVNEGEHFAKLRQIYHSFILAVWYKRKFKDSVLGRGYVDQKNVKGIDSEGTYQRQQIYEKYVTMFKEGVYNYIREDDDPASRQVIPRHYFSGGVALSGAFQFSENDPSMLTTAFRGGSVIRTALETTGSSVGSSSAVSTNGRDDDGVMWWDGLKNLSRADRLNPGEVQRLVFGGDIESDVWHEWLQQFERYGNKDALESAVQKILSDDHFISQLQRSKRDDIPFLIIQYAARNQIQLGANNLQHFLSRLRDEAGKRLKDGLVPVFNLPVKKFMELITYLAMIQGDLSEEFFEVLEGAPSRRELFFKLIRLMPQFEFRDSYLKHVFAALPARLSPHVLKGDLSLIRVPKSAYQMFVKAMVHPDVIAFIKEYQDIPLKRRLWVGDLLAMIQKSGFEWDGSSSDFYWLLPPDIRSLFDRTQKTYQIDSQGILYIPHDNNVYAVYNFRAIRSRLLDSREVVPFWDADGRIAAFEVVLQSGEAQMIPAADVFEKTIAFNLLASESGREEALRAEVNRAFDDPRVARYLEGFRRTVEDLGSEDAWMKIPASALLETLQSLGFDIQVDVKHFYRLLPKFLNESVSLDSEVFHVPLDGILDVRLFDAYPLRYDFSSDEDGALLKGQTVRPLWNAAFDQILAFEGRTVSGDVMIPAAVIAEHRPASFRPIADSWFNELGGLNYIDIQKKIFGDNVVRWKERYNQNGSRLVLEKVVLYLVQHRPDFLNLLASVDPQDLPFEVIRFVVQEDIYLGTRNCRVFWDELNRQAGSLFNRSNVTAIAIPDFIDLIALLGAVQKDLGKDFKAQTPHRQRLRRIAGLIAAYQSDEGAAGPGQPANFSHLKLTSNLSGEYQMFPRKISSDLLRHEINAFITDDGGQADGEARIRDPDVPGGIDLNAAFLEFDETGGWDGFDRPVDDGVLHRDIFLEGGVVPVIMNITPLPNLSIFFIRDGPGPGGKGFAEGTWKAF
jgi:hypothetical protein